MFTISPLHADEHGVFVSDIREYKENKEVMLLFMEEESDVVRW